MNRRLNNLNCLFLHTKISYFSSLYIIIIVFILILIPGNLAFASEVIEQKSSNNTKKILREIEILANGLNNDLETLANSQMEQVTNVNQLRDVSPTDWAYEALRSLVDRYGCIVGYPNQTYRGNRAISRYEFAAGLNSCLNQIERLIASSEAVIREDLDTIQRLIDEFEVELATLEGRIDNLEARTAFLEDNQFSTTTKLTGNVFFNLTGAFAGDDVLAETNNLNTPLTIRRAARDVNNNPIVSRITEDPEITFSYYTWLTLNTSFTGKDILVTQLVAGNGNSPANTFVRFVLHKPLTKGRLEASVK